MKHMDKEKIALLSIIVIQIVVYSLLGIQKSYLHMDEAYSIGLTNYDKVEITQNEDFYNHWHTKKYYEDYITIGREEVTDLKPVYENQKNDVHPPFYYLLLRMAYSFSIDHFSKWPGILLNIVILAISNLFVYKIITQIGKDKKTALLLCLVNGLVLASLESVMYIRMYALNSLMLLLVAYWHLKNFKKENITMRDLIPIGVTVLLAALTHYYNVIYIAIIYILYVIRYSKNKQYKNIIKYTITMAIAALIFLVIFPYAIQHIFMGYRGEGVLSSFLDVKQMIVNLCSYIWIANVNILNGLLGFILLCGILIVGYQLGKNRKITLKIENTKILLITIPALVYFLIVAATSPYTEIRYIIPVCSFLFIYILHLFDLAIKSVLAPKKAKIIFTSFLILLLIMPIITHAKIDNLYLQHKEIVKQVEEHYAKLPTIYLFNTNQNRFLDDIYLFSIIEDSYILDIEKANSETIEKILQDKNTEEGILLWVNEGFEKETYINTIMEKGNFKTCEHIKRMNACDIYYIQK